jgi:hypothetical protein
VKVCDIWEGSHGISLSLSEQKRRLTLFDLRIGLPL